MSELTGRLEAALLRRNPWLATGLQPGLDVTQIEKDLKRAGVKGRTAPLIELYSWRNGTTLHGSGAAFDAGLRAGFAPPVVSAPSAAHLAMLEQICTQAGRPFDRNMKIYTSFHFIQLSTAILHWKPYRKQSKFKAVGAERYFPFLWDGSSYVIALDLDPAGNGAVVSLDGNDPKILREAYPSFEAAIEDVIRANDANDLLTCIKQPGKHIGATAAAAAAPPPKVIDKKLPETEHPFVVRADFSESYGWKSLVKMLSEPRDEFAAELDFIDDPAFDGLTPQQLVALLPPDCEHAHAYIADRTTQTVRGNPLTVVDLREKPGRHFWVTLSAFPDVASNLALGNVGFDEYAAAVDSNGIFRGFPK